MTVATVHELAEIDIPGGERAVNRRFGAILALSMALHAALLAGVFWEGRPRPATPSPILATIRLTNVQDAGAASVTQNVPAAPMTPAAPVLARKEPARADEPSTPRRPAAPAKAAAPKASEAVAATAPASPAPEAVAPASTATAEAAQPVVPVESPAPVRPQGELLAGYRQRLTELFARQQEYPRIAAIRGWEGEVRLRLRVARKGNLVAVQLDHSSGFDVLDRHALAMLEAFAGLPPLPDGLEAGEIQVVVPINYKLKKTT